LNKPATILHPNTFDKSQWHITCPWCEREIGFDGVFHWGWVIEAIRIIDPKTLIMPMDFDCVVERHCHYLVIETKADGVPIPNGQLYTFNGLLHPKDFTIMKIWGKEIPNKIRIQNPGYNETDISPGIDSAMKFVSWWFKRANNDNKIKI